MRTLFGIAGAALLSGAMLAGCTREETPASTTYFDRKIGPVLAGSCARSPTGSGCHVTADDRGNALGNLAVDSYEGVALRRDLLQNYGPYGVPGLLLKVVPPYELRLTGYDEQVISLRSNVPHAGGTLMDFTSVSYATLQRWIQNGATANNAAPSSRPPELSPCATAVGSDPRFDPSVDPASPDWARFAAGVGRMLGQRCGAGNCHGSTANSLYLTCGTTPEQLRWNYFVAGDYVSPDVAASEILRRALEPAQGGVYHEGGVVFASTSDADWRSLRDWAAEKGGPTFVPAEEGFSFFAHRVQPMLARRGCMMLGCHSAAMFHDYRLRGGSGGHFGLPATRRNYDLSLEQLSLDSPDPNASRLIAKNLSPAEGGILHRGGPLFAGGNPAECDLAAAESGPLDEQSEYCVIVAWLEKERADRRAGARPLEGILFVRRPPAPLPDRPQDFETYAPGADLILATASLDAAGEITVGGEESLLGRCGLSPGIDVRRPAVSFDGARIAFSARTGASEPWRIYVIEGNTCALEPTIARPPEDDAGNPVDPRGALVHDFDPAFAPDGRIVFTSTRGNVQNVGAFSYRGPQRTPADPGKLNANLYVAEGGRVRQLTFLLNQELHPSFMNDGRVIFMTEKRVPGFYQLALRRINLDGGDYHPLFAQRPTVGHDQFSEVAELSNKNLVAIASERGAAHGAGTLVVINRSVGVDQRSQNPADYLHDEGALTALRPAFYQHSTSYPDPAATGRLAGTQGAYRNPSPLPNAQVLVSYAGNVQNLGDFAGNFDVVVVDPATGRRTTLIQGPDDELWPVAVYSRFNPVGVFRSRLDEANGASQVFTDERRDRSQITFLDLPFFTSLLFQNTRTGRLFEENVSASLWESLPPEDGVQSFDQGGAFVTEDQYGRVYARRRLLGGINLLGDGSARIEVPGGVPVVLSATAWLTDDSAPTQRFHREELQFYPGEWVRQGFRRELFDGFCAGCHGSVSGLESHVAVNPDVLTRASEVAARSARAQDLRTPSGPIQGPPFR